MKKFVGYRAGESARVKVHEENGEHRLNTYLNIRYHSPDGFEWGYYGSGPCQLGLAILMDTIPGCFQLGKKDKLDVVLDLYQRFTREKISTIPRETVNWEISEKEVNNWVKENLNND